LANGAKVTTRLLRIVRASLHRTYAYPAFSNADCPDGALENALYASFCVSPIYKKKQKQSKHNSSEPLCWLQLS